jgi:hypothetical protein
LFIGLARRSRSGIAAADWSFAGSSFLTAPKVVLRSTIQFKRPIKTATKAATALRRNAGAVAWEMT